MSTYNEKGEEILDPTPISVPVGFKRPIPLNERIREMVRREASEYARSLDMDTFEEADDFDTGDDDLDPRSPWEEDFDPEQKFIAARETEIRHGAVKDFEEDKIRRGHETVQKYVKKPPKKASAKQKSAAEGEQLLDSENESGQ